MGEDADNVMYINAKMRKLMNMYCMQMQCFPLLLWLVLLYTVLSCVLKLSSDISKERHDNERAHKKSL